MDWTLYYKSNNEAKYKHIMEEMKQVEERTWEGMANPGAKGKTWNPMFKKGQTISNRSKTIFFVHFHLEQLCFLFKQVAYYYYITFL